MKKLLVAFCLCAGNAVMAQDHSVDLATGTLNVNIPLYIVQDGDLSFPVGLSYTGNGVRITDYDGWLGHNWSISTDASVSREIRGIPDDYLGVAGSTDTRKGWLHGDMGSRIKDHTFTTDGSTATCSDEVNDYAFLNTFGYYEDTEPDMFNVNVPGLSFQFYFDENKVPQVVPYKDVVIAKSMDVTTHQVTSFTITDNNGVRYIFAAAEKIFEDVAGNGEFYKVRWAKYSDRAWEFTVAWKLTQILSPTYGTIDFIYENKVEGDSLAGLRAHRTFQYPLKIGNDYIYDPGPTLPGPTYTFSRGFTAKELSKIVTPSTEVEFLTNMKLANINVYEKRHGSRTRVKYYSFNYWNTGYYDYGNPEIVLGYRNFLSGVMEGIPSESFHNLYTFEYNGMNENYTVALPYSDSNKKDEWNFYRDDSNNAPLTLQETYQAGTLKKINRLLGSYTVFFYSVNEYRDGLTVKRGAGIRLRKSISHDGISSVGDVIKEYTYAGADGQPGGKLMYKSQKPFSVVHVHPVLYINSTTRPTRYRDIQQLITAGTVPGPIEKYFTVSSDQDLSMPEKFQGSAVGYEMVIVKQKDRGKSIHEFDIPAGYYETSANSNEWEASRVDIARPSTGTSACYDAGSIPTGFGVYPFPPNPNYDYSRGLLKKVTDYGENNVKVREATYEYQSLYGGTGIRKIYGLALEELPTYYYTTVYNDAKMFLYNKYAIFTDVSKVLKKQTETIYQSADLLKKNETVTEYFFGTGNHREVSKILRKNSDHVETTTWFKYVKDYMPIQTPGNAATAALSKLLLAHRTKTVVESYALSGSNTYVRASLTLFQEISGKVYPAGTYTFQSPDGITAFTPSSMQTEGSTSTFQFDQTRYTLTGTLLTVDAYGHVAEAIGRDRQAISTIWGYNGTQPILSLGNARLQEIGYSDFETPNACDFTIWASPTYSAGRTGAKGLNIPVGSTYKLVRNIVNNASQQYIFSAWINASTAGNLTITLKTGTTVVGTYNLAYTITNGIFKYFSMNIPPPSGTFTIEVTSSVAISADDIAIYPTQSSFKAYTYSFPFGKASETDSRGGCLYYSYDTQGRLKAVFDRDRNVVEKYDYQTRP
jgi:YD repeat-containing protein